MKSRSKSRRRKTIRNLDSYPDSLLDEEQKATENLFDVSDFNDQLNYERNFNCIFDMFRSVDLDQKTHKQSQSDKKYPRLDKFSSTVRKAPNYRQRFIETDKNKIQESKLLVKLYESHTEQDSSTSPTLRIRKEKILDKISSKNGINLTFKAFKSDSVFVAKNNHCESMITADEKRKKLQKFLNLKNNQNSLFFKKNEKVSNPKKLADLALQSPKGKSQAPNQQALKNMRTFSPQAKPHSILLECAQIQRLESLYTVRPLSKTTLAPCSELRKKGQEKMSPKSLEKPDTKDFGATLRINRKKELSPSRYNEMKKRKVFF